MDRDCIASSEASRAVRLFHWGNHGECQADVEEVLWIASARILCSRGAALCSEPRAEPGPPLYAGRNSPGASSSVSSWRLLPPRAERCQNNSEPGKYAVWLQRVAQLVSRLVFNCRNQCHRR